MSAIIAAVYAAATILLSPISYGIYQVRVAEALTVVPFFTRAAIPGLFIGCLLANVFGGMGWMDIVFGSLITLTAATLTYLIGRMKIGPPAHWLAPAPPVILNAFGVSLYLAPIIGTGYLYTVQMIGLGQLAACYLLGMPLLFLLKRRQSVLFN